MLRWRFEIELPIGKQGEFELAADLGWVRHIQEELNSAVPMVRRRSSGNARI